ncbi:KTSC domain-containing protein [Jongsikchunia kroppenstedtii]|uniref:KTSC domain-containing protein n=1 Tax=Jongsikchunia kroppenstedtii TaxID=1121721 RepID=UPI0005BA4635|nr:KTSC domain-containing protein [Jongsikchunia kroppenstedtii]
MDRTPVSSSVIASVGHDPHALVLEVEFLSGRIYQYFDVPLAQFDGLLAAESVGTYFNANIRDAFDYAELPGR